MRYASYGRKRLQANALALYLLLGERRIAPRFPPKRLENTRKTDFQTLRRKNEKLDSEVSQPTAQRRSWSGSGGIRTDRGTGGLRRCGGNEHSGNRYQQRVRQDWELPYLDNPISGRNNGFASSGPI